MLAAPFVRDRKIWIQRERPRKVQGCDPDARGACVSQTLCPISHEAEGAPVSNSRRAGLVAAAVLSLALGACGGSSSSGLSRDALVKKANAICASAIAEGKGISQPASFQDANVAAAYFDKIEPITADATTKLEALKADSSVSADWNAYIAARKAGLTLLQTIRHKADTKDPSGLRDLQRAPAVQQRVIAAANKLGATTCAQ